MEKTLPVLEIQRLRINENWAKTEGYQRLILDVGDSNDFAIALYTRKGFKPTGVTGHLPSPRAHILEHEMALDL